MLIKFEKNGICYKDFEPLKLLGTGSFSRLFLVRFISNNQLYAMKISSPFLVNIKLAFQEEAKLYIVSDFMQGGGLFYHLYSENKFCEKKQNFI